MQAVANRGQEAGTCTVARALGAMRGFTLIELMVTVAVLAVLISLAVPSFNTLLQRNRLIASANEVVAAMQTARMEAVRRNRSAILCPTIDGSTCSGGDWSRLLIFADANGDGAPAVGEIVRDVSVTNGNIVVMGSSNVTAGNTIRFSADGFARIGNANAVQGRVSVCSPRLPAAENTRDISIAVSRIHVQSGAGGATCGTAPGN